MTDKPDKPDKSPPINHLGIRFGDNDFYFTVMPFLGLLLPDHHTHPQLQPPTWTKPQIVELFNRLAYGIYLIKQNGWRYAGGPALATYLTINVDQVYLDQEVSAYLDANKEGCNGEFFGVDFRRRHVWSV